MGSSQKYKYSFFQSYDEQTINEGKKDLNVRGTPPSDKLSQTYLVLQIVSTSCVSSETIPYYVCFFIPKKTSRDIRILQIHIEAKNKRHKKSHRKCQITYLPH